MEGALYLFTTIFNFMKETTILSFSIGEGSVSITFLELALGLQVCMVGITFLHKILE